MEQYIVSARKYRPSTFGSVVGQQALTTTLKNAIATGRLAHAYLFCGGRGVGKTSCARIFAKTINCTNRTAAGEACNECDSCRQFNENRSMNITELDAASHNGVEDIRELIDQVMTPPATGRYRVFIIDEVHMLSSSAFNAFLKTLEEPPSHAIFILATTEKHKILPTILSRCQIYDFNRITVPDMVRHLQSVAEAEGFTADPAALSIIAQKADGAMRDALSIFDQVAASSGGNITYQSTIDNLNVLDSEYYNRLLDAFIAQDIPAALLIYKEVREKGFDSQFFINGLALYMRDLMLAISPSTLPLLEAPDQVKEQMAARAAKLHPSFIYKAMDLCNDADFNFRQASNKQFLIELTLIKLCQLLSPSPDESGSDEGHLLPLENYISAVPQPDAAATAVHAPVAAAAPARSVQNNGGNPQATVSTNVSHTKYSLGGMSLKAMKQERPTQPAMAVAQQQQLRSKGYTDADLSNAWKAVVDSYVDEPMTLASLQSATPHNPGAGKIALTVGTEIQADVIRKAEPAILKKLCDALENDHITIEISVQQGDLPPKYWTEQQVLKHITDAHPAVAEMIAKYQMRIV